MFLTHLSCLYHGVTADTGTSLHEGGERVEVFTTNKCVVP